jgi:hypothetical protein
VTIKVTPEALNEQEERFGRINVNGIAKELCLKRASNSVIDCFR